MYKKGEGEAVERGRGTTKQTCEGKSRWPGKGKKKEREEEREKVQNGEGREERKKECKEEG